MIRPFLMFQGGVSQQAVDLYVAVFDGAVLSAVSHAAPQQGIQLAELVIKGEHAVVSDSAGDHAFDFTPSTSLFVDCDEREELEHLTEVPAFARVGDRFGVSWQLNLAD